MLPIHSFTTCLLLSLFVVVFLSLCFCLSVLFCLFFSQFLLTIVHALLCGSLHTSWFQKKIATARKNTSAYVQCSVHSKHCQLSHLCMLSWPKHVTGCATPGGARANGRFPSLDRSISNIASDLQPTLGSARKEMPGRLNQILLLLCTCLARCSCNWSCCA